MTSSELDGEAERLCALVSPELKIHLSPNNLVCIPHAIKFTVHELQLYLLYNYSPTAITPMAVC